MNHIPTPDSTMFASIAYDLPSKTMEGLFRREGLYSHHPVPADLFERVLHPGPEHEYSIGKAYNALIKPLRNGRKLGRTLADAPAPRIQEALRESLSDPVSPAPVLDGISPAAPSEPDRAPQALPAEVVAVQTRSSSLATQAAEIRVTDPDTQVLAADMLITVAQMQTEIERTFAPMKAAAHKAHQVICQQETQLKWPLVTAEAALKSQIAGYVAEQNRLARETDEANRKAERERAEREAAAATIDQAIDQAIDLEARGNTKAAEAVLASPAPAPVRYQAPAPTQANVAATKGVSTRTSWDYRITDFNAIPREYLLINETAIKNAGKSTQGRIRIAGVEFFEQTVVATSRRG